jgi:hypothetical protein
MKDLLQTMRVFNPAAASVVADIEWQIKTDFIVCDMICVEDGNCDDPKRRTKNVLHQPFHTWLEDSEYLEWETNHSDRNGLHLQESGKIGYVDFINNNLTAEILHEYLFDTGRTSLAFDRSAL